MGSQIGLRFLAPMGTCSIPDQKDLAGHMALNMLNRDDHLLTLDGTFEMTLVDLARHRQSDCSRQNPPVPGHSPGDRPFALSCPGCCQRFQVREAKFVKEHDDCAETQRLFLSLASLLPAKLSPVLHPARQHVAVASERCSPAEPARAQAHLGDSLCQIPS